MTTHRETDESRKGDLNIAVQNWSVAEHVMGEYNAYVSTVAAMTRVSSGETRIWCDSPIAKPEHRRRLYKGTQSGSLMLSGRT